MSHTDRMTVLVAAMLTGQTAAGPKLIEQCIAIAADALRRIEEQCSSRS